MNLNNLSTESAFEILSGLRTQNFDDVDLYNNEKFNTLQMREIRLGIDDGIDISIYNSARFTAAQMHQIRLGILAGVDARKYAHPSINDRMMRIFRNAMILFPDKAKILFGCNYNLAQIKELYQGMIDRVDITKFSNPNYDSMQMSVIRESLLENWDTSLIENPEYDYRAMIIIKSFAKMGFNVINALDYLTNNNINIVIAECYLKFVIYNLIIDDMEIEDSDILKHRIDKWLRMQHISYGVPRPTDDLLKEIVGEISQKIIKL